MKHRSLPARLTASLALLSAPALALDGTEALGAPSIDFAERGEILLAGAGLVDAQPGSFTVSVPPGRTVAQVVAYWDGLDFPGLAQGETDTVYLNGQAVVGDRIGGASNFYTNYWVSSYRADVTGLGLVGEGNSLVTVEGLDFTYANDGLALVVVLEDDDHTIEVRDGLDYAYRFFPAPYKDTTPVVYTLEASDEEREATIDLLVGGVDSERPSVIEIRVDGLLVREEIDLLGNTLGAELDAISLDLLVPAGATEVSVELISEDRGGIYAGLQEASMHWLFSSLTLEASSEPLAGCDPWFWLCNWWRWDPWCTDDNLTSFDFHDGFNDTFGVSPWRSGLWHSKSLGSALVGAGWCNFWLRLLNREAVAALLNADSMNYPYSVDEVKALYRDAVGEDAGPETICTVLGLFWEANRIGCPF